MDLTHDYLVFTGFDPGRLKGDVPCVGPSRGKVDIAVFAHRSHERYLGGAGCISDEDACSRFLAVYARCNDWVGSYSLRRRSVQFIP